MTKEIWKEVSEFTGVYEVSNKGQVRSIDRVVIRSNSRPINVSGQNLSIGMDKDGYSIVQFNVSGKRYIRKVHRLVYEAFNGRLKKGLVIDHIDNDRTNNKADNLQQITNRLNVSKDRVRNLPTGVYKNTHGGGYRAQFQADGTSAYIGTFKTVKEASDAYKDALLQYSNSGITPETLSQRNVVTKGLKVCPMCKVKKKINEFYWANKKEGKRHAKCKECLKAYNKNRI